MQMTWKSVFLIWLLAMPVMGGVGYVCFLRNPAPFQPIVRPANAWKGQQLARLDRTVKGYEKQAAAKIPFWPKAQHAKAKLSKVAAKLKRAKP